MKSECVRLIVDCFTLVNADSILRIVFGVPGGIDTTSGAVRAWIEKARHCGFALRGIVEQLRDSFFDRFGHCICSSDMSKIVRSLILGTTYKVILLRRFEFGVWGMMVGDNVCVCDWIPTLVHARDPRMLFTSKS